ncbi:MAG: hypothetical protein CVU56_02415 [Deltaproteobacteria bacterium HGW-Deltaproteobacteria-14]|jgi:HD-like signal output (HDOD) protein|nr:MAG: hypothetical protein CVU56_02415 [Deltaproteobacteria bacterium HGW-Deltaproteobacteria-14]
MASTRHDASHAAAPTAEAKVRPIILFVDDEQAVLDGIRRQLRRHRDAWDLRFVTSGREALEVFSEVPVDILVTDVRMPGVDGLALLQTARSRFPEAVRVVLSGYTAPTEQREVYTVAHRVLPKPCDHVRLIETLSQAVEIRDLVRDRAVRALVGGVKRLPAVPHIYTQLQAVLQDDMSDAQTVARVIERDAVMVASVLRTVNSAAFALAEPVIRVKDAVAYLGRSMVSSMVLGLAMFDRFNAAGVPEGFLRVLQARAMATASVAMRLAERRGRNDAYVAAMLHDIGQLVMFVIFGEEYEDVCGDGDITAQERARFGAAHDAVGAYLLGLWGLPASVVGAVAAHHRQLSDADGPVARAVQLAELLLRTSEGPPGALDAWLDESPLSPDERARARTWLSDAAQPCRTSTARSIPRPRTPTVTSLPRPVTYRAIRRP